MPGDLQMLWRAEDPKQYHVEYAFSCMGYEIAGALGIKMAAPEREVYSLVGDGSYLMMAQEIVTAVSENIKLIVVIVQNHGFASIGSLSESLGSQRFGTYYRFRNDDSGLLDGDKLPVDLATNAESLGADVIRVNGIDEFRKALDQARAATRTTVDPHRDRPAGPGAVLGILVGRTGFRRSPSWTAPSRPTRSTKRTRPPNGRSSPPSREETQPMSTPTRDLSRLTLGTAPDSWGVWFAKDDHQVGWKQYLDEVANAGYVWTELGPQGFLPQDPAAAARRTGPARPEGLRRHRVRRPAQGQGGAGQGDRRLQPGGQAARARSARST